MPALTPYANKLLLDFMLGGASAPRPAAWFVGVDVDVARVSAVFAPASNYALLATSLRLGPVSSECTVVAVGLWDASTSGNVLWSCTLQTPVWARSGRELRIAAGDLAIGWQ